MAKLSLTSQQTRNLVKATVSDIYATSHPFLLQDMRLPYIFLSIATDSTFGKRTAKHI